MRFDKQARFVISAAAVAAAIAFAHPARAQDADATPEYKCFADLVDQSQRVFYFYDDGDLPSRFSDADNIARARIPNSWRKRATLIHECVLRDLAFSNPVANTLEIEQPQ